MRESEREGGMVGEGEGEGWESRKGEGEGVWESEGKGEGVKEREREKGRGAFFFFLLQHIAKTLPVLYLYAVCTQKPGTGTCPFTGKDSPKSGTLTRYSKSNGTPIEIRIKNF